MAESPTISVVIPVFNEEGNLPQLYERLMKTLEQMKVSFELLFVNDGSRDGSMRWIREHSEKDTRVKFIHLSRNFGHQVAVAAGLDHCTGKSAVIIDADLQDPPEVIQALYEKMLEGFEVVYAKRKLRKGEGFLKKFTAKIFYRVLSRITSIDIPLDAGDFRIIDRKIIDVLKQMPEQQKFLRGQIAWAGFRQTHIDYDREGRNAGKSNYSFVKMIRLGIDGITSFSDFPLKVATVAGFIVSGIAFLLILYALYSYYFLTGNEPGWASTIVSVLFIGGIQLIGIGIIGEYLGRMSSNVRNRPLYVVSETNLTEKKSGGEDVKNETRIS